MEKEVAGCGKAAALQASGIGLQASGKTGKEQKEKAGRVPGFFMHYRLRATPTRAQYLITGQRLQKGDMGLQMFCPCMTRIVLMAIQCFFGSFALRACSVSWGVFVFT